MINFALVGLLATGLQFLLLILFIEGFNLHAVTSSAGAYAISATNNYLLNYHLTFKSQEKHTATFPKFLMTSGIGILLNTLLFSLAFSTTEHYLLSQMIATGLTFISNYLLHTHWIYRN